MLRPRFTICTGLAVQEPPITNGITIEPGSTLMIRILYIIDSLTHGGTEKQLVQLIRHLDPEQFCVHLCTLKPSQNLYDELDIPKFCLNFISFGHRSIINSVASLASYVWRNNIDLVQTFFQDPFLLGAMIKPLSRIKLIGSFRDLGFWRTPAESRKMRLAYRLFDGFIANSAAVKSHFIQKDKIAAGKIKVIHNGIDFSEIPFAPPEKSIKNNPVVGIVANLNRPVKRVQDFVQAAGLVHQKIPETRFVVIGDGQLREELESLGNGLGLREVLTFTGRLASPLDFVRDFHVGVITSETEGLCNAILEYMACGVPVVATDTGGNPELIQHGRNGYLYPVGHVQVLADFVERIISDHEQRLVLGHSGKLAAVEFFSSGAMVKKHQDLYSNLIEQ